MFYDSHAARMALGRFAGLCAFVLLPVLSTGAPDPLVQLEAPDFPVAQAGDVQITEGQEGIRHVFVPISLSRASGVPVSVHWRHVNGTATAAGDDYVRAQGSVLFAPGALVQMVACQILGDSKWEEDEHFFVELFDPVDARIDRARGVVTLLNDDDQPIARIHDDEVMEGTGGETRARVTVDLSHASGLPVQVRWATRGASASAGLDFVADAGTLVFAPGSTSKRIEFGVVGDAMDEGEEHFEIVLSEVTGALLGDAEARIVVQDDDGPPELSLQSAEVVEGHDGMTVVRVGFLLSQPSAKEVILEYATRDGSARAAEGDYVEQRGTLRFPPGEDQTWLEVMIAGDRAQETTETFWVELISVENATLSSYAAWTFAGATGNEAEWHADEPPRGGELGPMRRGAGLKPVAAAGAFNAAAWTVAPEPYFSFTLGGQAANWGRVDRWEFEGQRSATGPARVAIRSSADEFGGDLAVYSLVDPNVRMLLQAPIPVMDSERATWPLEFRIYGLDAAASNGTFRIDNVRLYPPKPRAVVTIVDDDCVALAIRVPPEVRVCPGQPLLVSADVVAGQLAHVRWHREDATGPVVAEGSRLEQVRATAGVAGVYVVVARGVCGGEVRETVRVDVDGGRPPVVRCPETVEVSALPGRCDRVVTYAIDVADDCGVASLETVPASGSVFTVGTTWVSVRALDTEGLVTECTFPIVVSAVPEWRIESCPEEVTVVATADACGASVTWVPPVSAEPCQAAHWVASHQPGDWFTVGRHSVRYEAADALGRRALCEFGVNVVDTSGPRVNEPEVEIELDEHGAGEWVWDGAGGWAEDGCGIERLELEREQFGRADVGTNWVKGWAADRWGNRTDFTARVVVREAVRREPWLIVGDVIQVVRLGEPTTLEIPVTLWGASARPVWVDYETVAGSALAGRDYEPAAGTLRFSAGTGTGAPPLDRGEAVFPPLEIVRGSSGTDLAWESGEDEFVLVGANVLDAEVRWMAAEGDLRREGVRTVVRLRPETDLGFYRLALPPQWTPRWQTLSVRVPVTAKLERAEEAVFHVRLKDAVGARLLRAQGAVTLAGPRPAPPALQLAWKWPGDGSVWTSDQEIPVEVIVLGEMDPAARVVWSVNHVEQGALAQPPFRWRWAEHPPGTYHLRVSVTDGNGGERSRLEKTIEIRAPRTSELGRVWVVGDLFELEVQQWREEMVGMGWHATVIPVEALTAPVTPLPDVVVGVWMVGASAGWDERAVAVVQGWAKAGHPFYGVGEGWVNAWAGGGGREDEQGLEWMGMGDVGLGFERRGERVRFPSANHPVIFGLGGWVAGFSLQDGSWRDVRLVDGQPVLGEMLSGPALWAMEPEGAWGRRLWQRFSWETVGSTETESLRRLARNAMDWLAGRVREVAPLRDVGVSVEVDRRRVRVGDEVEFRVALRRSESAWPEGLVVLLDFPPGLGLVSAALAGGEVAVGVGAVTGRCGAGPDLDRQELRVRCRCEAPGRQVTYVRLFADGGARVFWQAVEVVP